MSESYVYNANATMKKLGQQRITEYVDATKSIRDITDAYTAECNKNSEIYRIATQYAYNMLLDIFVLGVIHGIRKERQRRKAGGQHGKNNISSTFE